jgi:hypothetical protein
MTSPTVTAPATLSALCALMDPATPIDVVTDAVLEAATMASMGALSRPDADMVLDAAWPALRGRHDLLEAADTMPAPLMAAVIALTVAGARAPDHVSTPSIGFRNTQPAGLYTAVVGEPGSGKSATIGAISHGMRPAAGSVVPDCANTVESPKTAAGLTAAYFTLEKETNPKTNRPVLTYRRSNHSVSWVVDEAEALLAHNSSSEPLFANMSSHWSGVRAGDSLKDKTQMLILEEGSYRSSLIAGVQPEKAPGLLSRKGQGFTQRTLFVLAETTKPAAVSGLLPLTAKATPAPGIDYRYQWPSQPVVYADDLPRWIEALLGRRYAELDTHRVQLACRVATLLVAVQGRHVIEREDLLLAKALVGMSRIVRDAIVVPAATAAAEAEAAQRGALDAVRQNSRDTALNRFSSNRMTKVAAVVLGADSCDGGDPEHMITVTARSISKEQRQLLADPRNHNHIQITMDELRPQRRHVLSATSPIQVTCLPGGC